MQYLLLSNPIFIVTICVPKDGECNPLCNNHNLIIHSECPERNDIAETGFNIIFYDISLFCLGYLLLTFLLATYLKGLAVYQKSEMGEL